MFKHILLYIGLLCSSLAVQAQTGNKAENKAIVPEDHISTSADTIINQSKTVSIDGYVLNEKQQKRYIRQLRRDSIRATKNIWWSVLGGPSYTPEASFGVGGAVLASFKMNKRDTLLQRSFLPAGINLSVNGTIVVAGAGTFFFNQNKFRIYASYGYRNEPTHYYGKGYETIEQTVRSDSTTQFHKSYFQLYPRFVWEVRPHLYVGTLFDINYSKMTEINPVMAEDPYFQQFKQKYLNVGIGGLIQYDTRDDVATPSKGLLLSANFKACGKYLGGDYNYEVIELEYRQFQPVFRPRSTLAWIVRSQISLGDVPFTELPSFGSPFDLRGYYWGKYRDKSMAYGIVEYRHMFGSPAKYKSGNFWAKCGFAAWGGTGTIGNTPFDWNKWKLNFGVGLRVQMQPGKNFRLDIGKGIGEEGMQIYMNMTEAF
ncbi:MAG: BamA/TamA family outer membrane protein [Tannerellaceae bacterium]